MRLEPNEAYIPPNAEVTLSCKIDSKCSPNCPEMQHDWTFNALPLSSLHPFANIQPRTIGKFALESQISLPSTMGNNRIGRFVCSTIAGAEAADVKLFPVPLAPVQTVCSLNIASYYKIHQKLEYLNLLSAVDYAVGFESIDWLARSNIEPMQQIL